MVARRVYLIHQACHQVIVSPEMDVKDTQMLSTKVPLKPKMPHPVVLENLNHSYQHLSRPEVIRHRYIAFLCLCFAALFFLGVKIFLTTSVLIESSKSIVKVTEKADIRNVQIDLDDVNKLWQITNVCGESEKLSKSKPSTFGNCFAEKSSNKPTKIPPAVINSKSEGNNFVVKIITLFIEFLLIAGLAIQLYFFVYTKYLSKSITIDYYIFHASDWAINTPPILGVLVNLLAFGAMLSQGAHKIQTLFTENFYLAIVTTLIGGFFYVINMFLKIFIQSRIDWIYKNE